MATYPELLELSKRRFAEPDLMRPVECLDYMTLEDIVVCSRALTGVKETIGKRTDGSYPERAQKFLNERGINFGRRALIGVGYFDDEDRVRALPMIGHKDRIGEYHSVIWQEYFWKIDKFVSDYPDCHEGVAYRQNDQKVLAVSTRASLTEERREVMREVSWELPSYVITLSRGGLIHDIFQDGDHRHVEIYE